LPAFLGSYLPSEIKFVPLCPYFPSMFYGTVFCFQFFSGCLTENLAFIHTAQHKHVVSAIMATCFSSNTMALYVRA